MPDQYAMTGYRMKHWNAPDATDTTNNTCAEGSFSYNIPAGSAGLGVQALAIMSLLGPMRRIEAAAWQTLIKQPAVNLRVHRK